MPRTSLEGVAQEAASFKLHSSVASLTITGDATAPAVVMTASEQVGLGADGGRLVGKLVNTETDYGTVIFRGMIRFTYSGSAPTVGASVVVDGTGKVKAATASAYNEVISVDTTDTTVVVKI